MLLLHGFTDPQTTVDVDCTCITEIVYYDKISICTVLCNSYFFKKLQVISVVIVSKVDNSISSVTVNMFS